MSNETIIVDDAGDVFKHVTGKKDEPLYIMRLYRFGADAQEAITRWTTEIISNEPAGDRLIKVRVSIDGRGKAPRASVAVAERYLRERPADVLNLVRSVIKGIADLDEVSVVRLSFFHREIRDRKQTTKELLTAMTGTLQQVAAGQQRIEESIETKFQTLLRSGLNYRQAATELGINEVDAFRMAETYKN